MGCQQGKTSNKKHQGCRRQTAVCCRLAVKHKRRASWSQMVHFEEIAAIGVTVLCQDLLFVSARECEYGIASHRLHTLRSVPNFNVKIELSDFAQKTISEPLPFDVTNERAPADGITEEPLEIQCGENAALLYVSGDKMVMPQRPDWLLPLRQGKDHRH